MKILGIKPAASRYHEPGFLVELTNEEMSLLAKGSYRPEFKGDFSSIVELDICEKWDHAMQVIEKCEEAMRIPAQLKAIAECLEVVTPKIGDVIEDKNPKEES